MNDEKRTNDKETKGMSTRSSRRTMGIREIMEILPHRPPFLLVDRILDLEPGVSAVGLKTITMNEPFFVGHFPGYPILPAVVILEAMAQVGGVMMLSASGNEGKIAYFTGIDKTRFRKPVGPGDTLVMRIEMLAFRANIGKVKGQAYVLRLEQSSLECPQQDATLASLPRNGVSLLVERGGEESRREKRLILGTMEGELAAEGELGFALMPPMEAKAGD